MTEPVLAAGLWKEWEVAIPFFDAPIAERWGCRMPLLPSIWQRQEVADPIRAFHLKEAGPQIEHPPLLLFF